MGMTDAENADRDRSDRSGGYSGRGGQDSPSEHGPGPGGGAGGSRSGGGGYSGEGGQDSPSESRGGPGHGAGDSRGGGGDYSGRGGRDSPSESGPGPGGGAGRSSGNGGGGNYSGYGGQDSPAERNAASRSPSGNLGDRLSGGLAGGLASISARQAENASMAALDHMRSLSETSPTARDAQMASMRRASENSSMDAYNAAKTQTDQNRSRADLAQQARASEKQSMADLARENALGTIRSAEVGQKDQYNTLSGGKKGDITSMTVRDAVDFAKKAWDGKITDVLGGYQFKGPTLAGIAEKMGLMDATMTPQVQDKLAVGLMQERANRATVNGEIDVDKFANELSREWASLADKTGKSHYANNGVDVASVSYGDVRQMAKDLVDNGVVTPNRTPNGDVRVSTADQTTTFDPDRFTQTYMGPRTQQNDPSGLPAGTYPGHVVGDGLAPSFATPNTPSAPTTPTGRPTGPATAPGTPPTQNGPFPDRPRSIAEQLTAGAIDVGLGMLPGAGMAFGVVNGGLQLTGNRTLGEHMVDSFATGQGAGEGPDSGSREFGGGHDREEQRGSDRGDSTIPEEPESFEDRYLAFVDPTPRPKPSERFDYSKLYAG